MSGQPWPSRKLDHVHERLRAADAVSKRRRFENLLERHEARLRRVAYGVLGDANGVDDVLQEALLKAYRALPARFESDRHYMWAGVARVVRAHIARCVSTSSSTPRALGGSDLRILFRHLLPNVSGTVAVAAHVARRADRADRRDRRVLRLRPA